MSDSFIGQTARAIMDTMDWTQLNRTTLVLPSHRAGLVLKEELLRLQQERHAQAVWAPQVQTLTQLQDSLSPLYAEDELMTVMRLYKLYLASSAVPSSTEPMPLDIFYGWGRQMIADFTNIDASMHSGEVPNFFENTIAAHELSLWQLDPEVEERLRSLMGAQTVVSDDEQSVRHQYERIWRQLYDLYRALHDEMEAENKGYTGMRQRAVIDHWEDDSIQQQIAGRTYVFVGFNYLLPVERELMQKLSASNKTLFYWDYVPDFQTNEKAFSFAQRNAQILGGINHQQSRHTMPVTLVECVSREAQAQYVHRWLQDNYTERGQKVGVVICDETMLEPVIYTLPAITLPGETEPVPVNITKGFPLRNTVAYARVMNWLADNTHGAADEVVQPEMIDAMLADLFPVTDTPSPVTDNTSSLTWQELLILESEYQVRKVANQMRLLLSDGSAGIPFTRKLLRLLMRRAMESVTMPFHGEPVTDVQVMGVLETRLLDFDKLLILNVEEGVIPQRQTDSSFIPYYLRKAYHMQTSDERATVYAYNFFRLLSRAGHSTILYAAADTSDGGKGMSRFVMQIRYSSEFEVRYQRLQEAGTLSPLADDRLNGTCPSLLSTLSIDADGVIRRPDGKLFRLSPSALNTYISCPRSFYLQYILGLRPGEEEEVLFEVNTLGSFVHHTMEYLYRTCFGCDNSRPVRVTPEAIEAVRTDEALLQKALMAAYDAMNAEKAAKQESGLYIPEHHSCENVVILGYVNNVLERDREDAKTGLQIYMLEKDCTFPVALDGIGTLRVGGKIDRLDIYGEEGHQRLRVVDYKSGSYSDSTHAKKMSATWEEMMESEDKGYVRQTLVYSHAVQQTIGLNMPVEPHLFFCRRRLTDIVTTIDVANETVTDYKTVEQPFYEALCAKTAELMTATAFPPCDEDQCKSFCPFFDLCGRKPKEF